jgi:hypothetical protein
MMHGRPAGLRVRASRGAWIAAFLALVAAGTTLALTRQEPFPHREHARLFSFCTGCHVMDTGVRADAFPAPELCARCHDGTIEERVRWAVPEPALNNLVFDHVVHAREAAGDALECEGCHTPDGAPRMTVQRADAPECLSCHAHRAQQHYVDADCATCHRPLAETRFAAVHIAGLPEPPSHEQPDFLEEAHGALAESSIVSCAVCHTRERCATCHVDAADVAAIGRMPAAPANLALPEFEARYVRPRSHDAPDFNEEHGEAAATGRCGACHTRDDCATCHVAPLPGPVAALRVRGDVQAPGAPIARRAPVSHASPGFAVGHGADAATDGASCTACHTRTSCNDCHDAPARAVFHPAHFLARHSAEAYGRRLECSNCHETQTFCRDCHVQTGTQAVGRLGPGFHDAEPLWLLRHGTPARRVLESCTTCHRQRDCLQCHSTLGAFRVNPHGPGFDPQATEKKNPIICKACHVA